MALTVLIAQELLATLDTETDPQAVLRRYAGSKGPLYAALARATAQATARFGALRARWLQTQAQVQEGEKAAAASEQRASQAARRLQAAERDLARVVAEVERQQPLLDAAVAQAESVPPAEAAARFIQAATDYAELARFRQQVDEAEKRAKEAVADAAERERNARVRAVAIAWAAWFVQRGVTENTVAAWEAVGQALGLTAENLAQGLNGALQQFGSLEAACRAKAQERDTLAVEVVKLTSGNKTLREEQARIRAALDAVTNDGGARIARLEKAATAAIEGARTRTQGALAALDGRMTATLDRLAALEREAAELQTLVGWARALASRTPDNWRHVEPDAWVALMWHLGRWVEAAGANPDVPLPESLRKSVEDQAKYPALYGPVRVPLRALAAWLAKGLRDVPAEVVWALAAGPRRGRADERA